MAAVKPVPETVVPPAEPSVEASSVEADEMALEQVATESSQDDFLHAETEETPPEQEAAASTTVATPATIVKDDVMKEVEKILEDGLGDYFHTLPADAQKRFEKKGEEVAVQVAVMVRGFTVEVKRVLRLIRDWLLTVPGVNKFFLEQEAKIKTDRILALEQAIHERPLDTP